MDFKLSIIASFKILWYHIWFDTLILSRMGPFWTPSPRKAYISVVQKSNKDTGEVNN